MSILKEIRAAKPQEWTCMKCHPSVLPFHKCTDLLGLHDEDESDTDANAPYVENEHLKELTSRCKQLRLAHLNTQSMVSTFDDLLATLKEYPFDVFG